MKLFCLLGLHSWGKWGEWLKGYAFCALEERSRPCFFQFRHCSTCGMSNNRRAAWREEK